jgi:hypothetical protein
MSSLPIIRTNELKKQNEQNNTTRIFLFRIFAGLSAGAAIFHLVNLLYRFDHSPAWRHIMFFFVGVICVYGFLVRPKYFLILFALLLIQQYYSHGSSLVNNWIDDQKINWINIGVLIIMPPALVLLIQDYKQTRQ